MTGPKLNEKSFVAGERSGTKASAKYVRSSASKARVVLNLIRDKDVRSADEILAFTDREMAVVVRKVLASAVANAVNNDGLDADELYVKACFADEGPTLRRFAARARGRGTRINKRTCHITVVVARLDDDRLQVIQAKADSRGGATARRRARVEESRKRAASKKSEVTEPAEQVEEQEEVTSVNEEVVEAEASEAGEEN
jgi:large subunit ribosomal protein L22